MEKLVNRVIYLSVAIPNIVRYLFTTLFLIIIAFIWLFIFYKPLTVNIKLANSKFNQLNQIKDICSKSYFVCDDLNNKINHIKYKISKNLSLIETHNSYLSLAQIIECISQNKLTLADYSPFKFEKLEFGKKASFELLIEGSLYNFFNFFKSLSEIKYCLKYNQISLNKKEQGLLECRIILDILQLSK